MTAKKDDWPPVDTIDFDPALTDAWAVEWKGTDGMVRYGVDAAYFTELDTAEQFAARERKIARALVLAYDALAVVVDARADQDKEIDNAMLAIAALGLTDVKCHG